MVTDRYTVDPVSGCWVWNAVLASTGYGTLREKGTRKTLLAHRWMYENTIGPVPNGYDLDHLCRNTACVNPDHLEPVLPAENCQRGARAKLSAQDVETIRACYAAGEANQPELARRFGVHNATVSRIVRGLRWPKEPKGRSKAA